MMNLGQWKTFFSSLSRVSQWDFEVWNAKGGVLSSPAHGEKMPQFEGIRELSVQIMDRPVFQHVSFLGKYDIFGVPIKNGAEVVGALVAYIIPLHDLRHQRKLTLGCGHARVMV